MKLPRVSVHWSMVQVFWFGKVNICIHFFLHMFGPEAAQSRSSQVSVAPASRSCWEFEHSTSDLLEAVELSLSSSEKLQLWILKLWVDITKALRAIFQK